VLETVNICNKSGIFCKKCGNGPAVWNVLEKIKTHVIIDLTEIESSDPAAYYSVFNFLYI
jgi:hypothetical protein